MELSPLLERESLALVFTGDFNPVILTPAWLVLKGLIREEEADNAEVAVIHNDLIKYDLGWVTIESNRTRCQFSTTQKPYFELVKDLITSVFRVLKETPVHGIGINHITELNLKNKKSYFKFGSQLTQLNYWSEELNDPRLLSLEILEEDRMDKVPGSYRVKVSPTGKNYGVIININDHIDVYSTGDISTHVLEENWIRSSERATEVVKKFLKNIQL